MKGLNDCIDINEKSHMFFTNNQAKLLNELTEQLTAKDKALENACLALEKYNASAVDNDYYGKTSFMNKEKWKEWCMSDEFTN